MKRTPAMSKEARAWAWERDRGICAWCGTDCGETNWDADHRIPLAAGGEHSAANIRTLCKRPCHARATRDLRMHLNRVTLWDLAGRIGDPPGWAHGRRTA